MEEHLDFEPVLIKLFLFSCTILRIYFPAQCSHGHSGMLECYCSDEDHRVICSNRRQPSVLPPDCLLESWLRLKNHPLPTCTSVMEREGVKEKEKQIISQKTIYSFTHTLSHLYLIDNKSLQEWSEVADMLNPIYHRSTFHSKHVL